MFIKFLNLVFVLINIVFIIINIQNQNFFLEMKMTVFSFSWKISFIRERRLCWYRRINTKNMSGCIFMTNFRKMFVSEWEERV